MRVFLQQKSQCNYLFLFGIVGNFVILYNLPAVVAAWLGFFRRQVLKEIYLHFFAEIFG